MSASTWPGRRRDLIWLTLDSCGREVNAVLDALPSWVDRVKAEGTGIVMFGVSGKHRRRPRVQQLIDTNIIHASKHRVCSKPLVQPLPGAPPSATSFVALTGEPTPNQLCHCSLLTGFF